MTLHCEYSTGYERFWIFEVLLLVVHVQFDLNFSLSTYTFYISWINFSLFFCKLKISNPSNSKSWLLFHYSSHRMWYHLFYLESLLHCTTTTGQGLKGTSYAPWGKIRIFTIYMYWNISKAHDTNKEHAEYPYHLWN